jgi:hypothetical protein
MRLFHQTILEVPRVLFFLVLCSAALAVHANAETFPLPSWNDGAAKQAIISFVKDVTDKSGPKYVAPQDRIATFDQDVTFWVEHPLYTQAMFALAIRPAIGRCSNGPKRVAAHG